MNNHVSTARQRCNARATVVLMLLAASACHAQLADLVDHDSFEACWAQAVTTDEFLQLVAASIENASPDCVPAGKVGDVDYCNNTMCPGDIVGCPIKIHSGPFTLKSLPAQDSGVIDVATSSGSIDPFSMPVTVPIVGDCIMSFNDTSTTKLYYDLLSPTRYDGVAGLYTTGFPLPSSLAINGLVASDVSLGGGFGCLIANLGLSFFIGTLTDQLASQLLDNVIPQTTDLVGQSICPARP